MPQHYKRDSFSAKEFANFDKRGLSPEMAAAKPPVCTVEESQFPANNNSLWLHCHLP